MNNKTNKTKPVLIAKTEDKKFQVTNLSKIKNSHIQKVQAPELERIKKKYNIMGVLVGKKHRRKKNKKLHVPNIDFKKTQSHHAPNVNATKTTKKIVQINNYYGSKKGHPTKHKSNLWGWILLWFIIGAGICAATPFIVITCLQCKNSHDVIWKSNWISKGQLKIKNNILLGVNESFNPNYNGYDTLMIPKEVEGIQADAFNAAKTNDILRNISYLAFEEESRCTFIGVSAFSNVRSFKGDLLFPEKLSTIDDNAFINCVGFNQNIVLNEKLSTIGQDAFYGNKFKTIINNSKAFNFATQTSVGNAQVLLKQSNRLDFDYEKDQPVGCLASGNLTIPSATTSIGSYAFYGCNGLVGDLVIPSSVINIGYEAFGGCNGFDYNTTNVTSDSGGLIRCAGEWIISADKTITSINWDNTSNKIIGIMGGCFANCDKLIKTDILFTSSLTSIGEKAFYNTNLTKIATPASSKLIRIGEKAFGECKLLTSATLDFATDLNNVGSLTFINCDELVVLKFGWQTTIPNGIATINDTKGGALEFIGSNGGSVYLPIGTLITMKELNLLGLDTSWVLKNS